MYSELVCMLTLVMRASSSASHTQKKDEIKNGK